jgi:WhiB family transcriptional regulator, redox-sensing transcriptional regulator
MKGPRRLLPLDTDRGRRDEDPQLFFPIAAQGPRLVQVTTAKAACRRCAVNAACLTFGLQVSQEGTWGGATREERRAMSARRVARDGHEPQSRGRARSRLAGGALAGDPSGRVPARAGGVNPGHRR